MHTALPVSLKASAPTDMALNHGTYCSERCAEVFDRYRARTGLRTYPAADNGDLRAAIAAHIGVDAEHVLVGNGSGPLLKTVIPYLVEREIKSSLTRTARYLLRRKAYPLITTRLTYSKVPAAAVRVGLRCELLPLRAEDGFALDIAGLDDCLAKRPGLVYLCNPNNPTGNVLVTRAQLEPLLERHRDAWFFIDEAYVHYADSDQRLPQLVRHHPNLVVMRSFSFAYGMGAVRVGFVVTAPDVVRHLDEKQTPHRVGQLAADLAMASMSDAAHLDFVRGETRRERERVTAAMRRYPDLTVFPSQTNFVLAATASRSGRAIHDALLARGVQVKVFEPFADQRYDELFRVTIGLPAENDQLLDELERLLGPII